MLAALSQPWLSRLGSGVPHRKTRDTQSPAVISLGKQMLGSRVPNCKQTETASSFILSAILDQLRIINSAVENEQVLECFAMCSVYILAELSHYDPGLVLLFPIMLQHLGKPYDVPRIKYYPIWW